MITISEAQHQLYDDLESAISLLKAAAHAEGVVEGTKREHDRLFGLMSSACCYPIDGDKLFALPITYGDALPIKEPPCSG